MAVAAFLLWRHWWAHLTFVVTLCGLSAWNASSHYAHQFALERGGGGGGVSAPAPSKRD